MTSSPSSNASPTTGTRSDPRVIVVGAGAAGLFTAIFARRFHPDGHVWLVDGARRPGAKILVSGGSRCNVTNAVVTDRDFWGGHRATIRRVLRAFPAEETVAFFRDIGVPLHEEAGGKLFPDSNRSRDVLDALIAECDRVGVRLLADHRVGGVTKERDGFRVTTSHGDLPARLVVLATGGLSLPKTGSDGTGLAIAARLGHTIVPTTPALAPLVFREADVSRTLSGVSHDVELTLWVGQRAEIRVRGALLWTHFGLSGPAALDASRHLLRAQIEGREATLTANLCGGLEFDAVEHRWTALVVERPRVSVLNALSTIVPSSFAEIALQRLGIDPGVSLAHLARDDRRRLVHALVAWPLPVVASRGYTFAEATAGGIALSEIDSTAMESRLCAGLYLVGEMLDVDGRIGGFNFQWAWSSGFVAGRAVAKALVSFRPPLS